MLVVDDDATIRDAVVAMLEELGHEQIDTAEDGLAAMELLRAAPSSVLILDLMMPRMDGFEVLREIRNGAVPRPRCIVVMSAHADADDQQGLHALGADAFLPKPFTLDELERIMTELSGESPGN